MKRSEIQLLVVEAIQQVAPEIELDDIQPDSDIRDECDLDSMDLLNYLIALKKLTGVDIAEADYPKVNSLNKMCDYLEQKRY